MLTPPLPLINQHYSARHMMRGWVRDHGHTANEAKDIVSHLEARSAGEAIGQLARTPDELELLLSAATKAMEDRAKEAFYSSPCVELEPASVAAPYHPMEAAE